MWRHPLALPACLSAANASHGGKRGDRDRQQRGTEEILGMSDFHLEWFDFCPEGEDCSSGIEEATQLGTGSVSGPHTSLDAGSRAAAARQDARERSDRPEFLWTGQEFYEQGAGCSTTRA